MFHTMVEHTVLTTGGKLELGDELSNNLKKNEAEPKGNRAQMISAIDGDALVFLG